MIPESIWPEVARQLPTVAAVFFLTMYLVGQLVSSHAKYLEHLASLHKDWSERLTRAAAVSEESSARNLQQTNEALKATASQIGTNTEMLGKVQATIMFVERVPRSDVKGPTAPTQ
jgi:ADP-ribosylglycohydrolase